MKRKTRMIYLPYLPELSQDRFLVAPYGTAESEWPEVTSPSCCLALLNFHWQQIFKKPCGMHCSHFPLEWELTPLRSIFFFLQTQTVAQFLRIPRLLRDQKVQYRVHERPCTGSCLAQDLRSGGDYRILSFGMWRRAVCWNSLTLRRSTSPPSSEQSQTEDGGRPPVPLKCRRVSTSLYDVISIFHINLAHVLPHYLFEIHFNIYFPRAHRSSKFCLRFSLSDETFPQIYHKLNACYMSCNTCRFEWR